MSMPDLLEALAKQGFTEVAIRLFSKGSVWASAPEGVLPQTEWYCCAWKPGTTELKSGCGATPNEALIRAVSEEVTVHTSKYAHEVYSDQKGFKLPEPVKPKPRESADGSWKPLFKFK